MSKYKEDLKRKDRVIKNCQDIESVLKDFDRGTLELSEAKTMLFIAFMDERAEGYRSGFDKQKKIKKR